MLSAAYCDHISKVPLSIDNQIKWSVIGVIIIRLLLLFSFGYCDYYKSVSVITIGTVQSYHIKRLLL